MKELEYPFDAELLIKQKKSLKRKLLESLNGSTNLLDKKVAILGGQTTQDIKLILELFLLNYGIKPTFYESEYNQFYEDGFFPNPELESFAPDVIYVCTSIRNIVESPSISDSLEEIALKRKSVTDKFENLWNRISERYKCPIIQNNFEYPFSRLLGNKDCSDQHGLVNFVTSLNDAWNKYAQNHDNFYICDVNYLL